MKQPSFDAEPTKSLSVDQVRKLLKACSGTDFTACHDQAVIRLICDTGLRRGELAAMRTEDVDLDTAAVKVMGKGRKVSPQPIGPKVVRDIDRYLRIRAKHHRADLPSLWIGQFGSMTGSGVYEVIQRRETKLVLRNSTQRGGHTAGLPMQRTKAHASGHLTHRFVVSSSQNQPGMPVRTGL